MRVSEGVREGSRALLAVGLAAVLLAGCGGGSGAKTGGADPAVIKEIEAEEAAEVKAKAAEKCPALPASNLDVALDDWETPETAGILMADKRGYFADEGLKVSTLAPPGPGAVIPDVVSGADAIGVSHEPEAVLAKEEGEPIVIVGSLVSQPTASLIWLKKSNINGIADLKGKTIAIPGLPFQEHFLEKVLATGGLTLSDVEVESTANETVSDLVSGQADAIFGRSDLHGAELETRGLEPVITRVENLGFPDYNETVLIAQSDCVSKRPKVFRKFLAAVGRGTVTALEDPEGTVDALEAEGEHNPETSRKAMKAQVQATFPLLSRSGYVSPAQARDLVDWMQEEEMILRKVPVKTLLTNAYLPHPQTP